MVFSRGGLGKGSSRRLAAVPLTIPAEVPGNPGFIDINPGIAHEGTPQAADEDELDEDDGVEFAAQGQCLAGHGQ
jgi:hypothetical protein